ncbi:MAG: type II/IV secretion system ATPase subunit [Candidatus Diapherotrites archaeon]|nr:type II/IV secretion system ATPase subunit [Candidatus Diapherotrites archaeon]
MTIETAERLEARQEMLSALKGRLSGLLFLEDALQGKDFKPKNLLLALREMQKKEAVSKEAAAWLAEEISGKKLSSREKTEKESVKEFVKAFNLYGRIAGDFSVEAGFIVIAGSRGAKEKIAGVFSGGKGIPGPVKGGQSAITRVRSLFVEGKAEKGEIGELETEPGQKARKAPGFGSGIAKTISSMAKRTESVRKMFGSRGIQTGEKIQEVFKVPIFATGSGLAEKTTTEDFRKVEPGEDQHAETILSLKETLFAEGKKTEVTQDTKDLITLIPGYAYGKIISRAQGQKVYYIIEPDLSDEERDKITKIKNELIEVITIEELSREKMFEKVESIISKRGYTFSSQGRHKLMYYLSRDLLGLERIEPLMHDPLIEDIECDGTDIPVYVVHQKQGHVATNIVFKNMETLEDFIIKLAQLSKTYVSYASPLVDSVLPDGSRINAVLTKSVSTKGPSFTIRLFPEKPLPPSLLVRNGTMSARIAAYLWTVIEFRKSILITGPTASGKTTILNAVSMFIPYGNRVVSIEDTRELNIKHENWLPQVARQGFGPPDATGKRFGEVDMMTLIMESFRQRPDYLIVGEVRGKETFVLFQGMASGHCSMATLHARSVDDVVSRLTTPPINLYPSLLESVDVILNVGFIGEQEIKRKIRTIAEVKKYNAKELRLEYNDLLENTELEEIKDLHGATKSIAEFFPITGRSFLLKRISKEHGIPLLDLQKKIERRTAFMKKLAEENVSDYTEFSKRLEEFKNAEGKA